ncbi:MAG: tRNA 2-thiouridine(34) synthase MnmA [Clostridia bacterium]|jgi:tRNA-specific 2-thiouridylase|nr:tRNA 2-thiouridine(34) synthase MnmA [Clostridia bacterium]
MSKEIVVIGLSGGVDSSVSAYLLKKAGYDVIGMTLLNHDNGMNAVNDAKAVAEKLGIKHITVDCREKFQKIVENYFVSEYLNGRTPNPCVVCNPNVKWDALMSVKEKYGASYVATGHYAQIIKYPLTGRLSVKMTEDNVKDQTYVLSFLTQEQLKNTIFPLGDYKKPHVREIAAEVGIPVAEKPDSEEICFIPDNDYAGFIKSNTEKEIKPGNYIDMDGNVIGKHKGIIYYTIGQRKGLGMSFGKHMFVNSINADTNEIVLGDNDKLFKKTIYAENISFMAVESIDKPLRAEAKIRYAHRKSPCTVSMENGLLKCVFEEPQRAVTPGQAIVIYKDDYCLCGAIIK